MGEMRRLFFFAMVAGLCARRMLRSANGRWARSCRARFAGSHVVVDSAAVRDYVKRIGDRIASGYTFDVIVDNSGPLREPISLPGGYIFASTGLLLAAHDESEFAGMLAHAMGHLAGGHYRRQMMRDGSIPVIFIGAGGDALLPSGMLSQQREFELDADRWTVDAMARAGWNPASLLRYVEREQPAEGSALKYSALPAREARIANLEQAIRLAPRAADSESGEFLRVQQEIRPVARPIPSLRNPR